MVHVQPKPYLQKIVGAWHSGNFRMCWWKSVKCMEERFSGGHKDVLANYSVLQEKEKCLYTCCATTFTVIIMIHVYK